MASLHGFERFIGQRLNLDKPLGRDHGFDDFAAALRTRYVQGVRLLFDHQSLCAHVFPQFLAALEAIQSGIRTAVLIDVSALIEDVDEFQLMILPNGIIVGVVGRSDLYRTGTKFTIHVFIGDDRNMSAQNRHYQFFAQEFMIAVIFRMDGYCSIPQNGLGASGGYRDVFAGAIGQHIFEVIQKTGFLRIFHLKV